MRHQMIRVALMTIVLSAGLSLSMALPKRATTTDSNEKVNRGEVQDQEKKVKMQDLPDAVQKTVREQSQGAVIRGLAQETENGETNYEVELKVNGHNKDVLISSTGDVVEIEEQVTLESLPAAVKTAIRKAAGTGRIGMIESITKDNAVIAYEAHVRIGGKSHEIKVGADGELISKGQG
jgi:uncharacterized membrane protein YkoI